jgi:hypothetical protein
VCLWRWTLPSVALHTRKQLSVSPALNAPAVTHSSLPRQPDSYAAGYAAGAAVGAGLGAGLATARHFGANVDGYAQLSDGAHRH